MRTHLHSDETSVERSALRSRIKSFYRYMNLHAFGKCFSFLDPILQEGRVDEEQYVKSLAEFLEYYGAVHPVVIKIDLYLGMEVKRGPRDFAYPLIVWKDSKKVAHLFNERWVKNGDQWYTRVAGLVTPDANGTEHRREQKAHSRRRE